MKVVRRSIIAGVSLLIVVALGHLAAGDAAAQDARPRVHVLAFGLWGANPLFKREAVAAADTLARYFGGSGQHVVRANTPTATSARVTDMRETLAGLASTIDGARDVVVVFITSHGGPDGVGIVVRDSRKIATLAPAELGRMLRAVGIRNRVLIVSACYSGVFADALADDDTLVITAADSEHSSFGCSDNNPGNYTYFGQAFFGDSLKPGMSLERVFGLAKARVMEREMAEHLQSSNPQMKGGAHVLELLAR